MKKYFILTFTVLALFACSTIKTSFDYDKQADFSKYKTYQFSNEVSAIPINQLNRDRLIAAIETEMAAKGFTKSDNPDVLIDIIIKADQKVDATATTTGTGYRYPYRYAYGGGFSTTQVTYNEYTVGTLFISMVDNSMQKIVWQGIGVKTLNENASPEKREENINYAVKQIFLNYPPVK